MHHLALKVSFDGTDFWGWQKTGSKKSVEDALEQALFQVFQQPIAIEAASRLDRGVHAAGQIIAIHTPKEIPDLSYRLNCLLPPSIRIQDCVKAPPNFHPSLQTEKKEYRYRIYTAPWHSPFLRLYSWHVPQKLSLEAMQNAALQLHGTKDFKVFCNFRKGLNYKNHERTLLTVAVHELEENLLEVVVIGDHFLYKMVRNIAGLLVGYGKGMPLLSVDQILERQDKTLSYVTAPACGLTLQKVYYPFELFSTST